MSKKLDSVFFVGLACSQIATLVLLGVTAVSLYGGNRMNAAELKESGIWMHGVQEYLDRSTADRVTHSSVEKWQAEFSARNGLVPVKVDRYEIEMSFPELPERFK